MGINLSDHIKEIKLAKDIIIDSGKALSGPGETRADDTNDNQSYKWLSGLVVLVFIILVFLIWKYYVKG